MDYIMLGVACFLVGFVTGINAGVKGATKYLYKKMGVPDGYEVAGVQYRKKE